MTSMAIRTNSERGNQDISTVVAPTIPLLLLSSDHTVVDPALIEVNADGKLFFKPGAVSGTKGGTVTLTVMSTMGSSAVNASFSITVYEPAAISTLQIQGISSTMYAGQWAPMVVYASTSGNFLSLDNINTPANLAKLKIVSSNPAVIPAVMRSATGIRYNTTTKVLNFWSFRRTYGNDFIRRSFSLPRVLPFRRLPCRN